MKRKRTGKFYFKNEKEVMDRLGLKPTQGSGSGWIEKEDGSNDFIICQHKSTDSNSYSLKQEDIRKLEYHALVEKKIPIFAIEFLQTNDLFLVIKPEDICDVYNYLTLPENATHVKSDVHTIIADHSKTEMTNNKIIKSSNKESYWKSINKEKEKQYGNSKDRQRNTYKKK